MSDPINIDRGQLGRWRSLSRGVVVCTIVAAVGSLCCAAYIPCISRPRDTGTQALTVNNLKQIAVALENYHDTFGHLPPPAVCDKAGKPLYSWRVALLPFLEQEKLYKDFHLDEPWDSAHNLALLNQMPRAYHSLWGGYDPIGTTRFQALVGPGTAFERDGLTWNDFPDGRENTIIVVEAANPVPWSKPTDLSYDPNGPLPQFKTHNIPVELMCYAIRRRPVFVAAFGDGRFRFIRTDVRESTIRALITRNGGEKVDLSSID